MTARRAATLSLSAAVLGLMLSFSGARADEPAHPALWKIQNGSNTVYLFGSLHILPEDFQWITPTLKSAMEDSKQFVFEVSTDDEALMDQKTFIKIGRAHV